MRKSTRIGSPYLFDVTRALMDLATVIDELEAAMRRLFEASLDQAFSLAINCLVLSPPSAVMRATEVMELSSKPIRNEFPSPVMRRVLSMRLLDCFMPLMIPTILWLIESYNFLLMKNRLRCRKSYRQLDQSLQILRLTAVYCVMQYRLS